jgi:hypothetical protein
MLTDEHILILSEGGDPSAESEENLSLANMRAFRPNISHIPSIFLTPQEQLICYFPNEQVAISL